MESRSARWLRASSSRSGTWFGCPSIMVWVTPEATLAAKISARSRWTFSMSEPYALTAT